MWKKWQTLLRSLKSWHGKPKGSRRLQLLELARSCKDLDELVKKLEAMTVSK